MDVNHIDCKIVKNLLDSGEKLILLDVRTKEEFELVHIQGCVHVPLDALETSCEELPKDQLIITYCHHGPRGIEASAFLKAEGFDKVENLKGGIDAWAEEVEESMARY